MLINRKKENTKLAIIIGHDGKSGLWVISKK